MYKHTDEYANKLFECKYCDMKLASERLLIKHLQKMHKTEVPNAGYPCPECGRIFRDKHNLESHKLIHLNIKPHGCEICHKSFRKSSDLTIHFRIHTGEKPHTCDICNMSFTTNSNLNKHKLTHTGEKPHACKYCNRRFTDKSHLNRHYLIHTGEKPHVCDICNKGFATKAQCVQHMLVHTGEKPFQCTSCGKTFRQKAKAQKHRCLYRILNQNGGQMGVAPTGAPVQLQATNDVIASQQPIQTFAEIPNFTPISPQNAPISLHQSQNTPILRHNTPNVPIHLPFQLVNSQIQPLTLNNVVSNDVTYQVIDAASGDVIHEQVPGGMAEGVATHVGDNGAQAYQVIVNQDFQNLSVQVLDGEVP